MEGADAVSSSPKAYRFSTQEGSVLQFKSEGRTQLKSQPEGRWTERILSSSGAV